MKHAIVAAFAVLFAATACRTSQVGPAASITGIAPADGTPGQVATASAAAEAAGPARPVPVVFSPGETIAEDDLGLYLLDPATGRTEAWGTSPDHRCNVERATVDGRKLLFTCNSPQEPVPPAGTPSPGQAAEMYVLDLVTGDWSPLVIPADSYGIVSPNGDTLSPAAIDALRAAGHAPGDRLSAKDWAPDGSAFVAYFNSAAYLIRMDSEVAVRLADLPPRDPNNSVVAWAPDGSKVALVDCCRDWRYGTVTVFDADGRKLWMRDILTFFSNPRWSPDSRRLGVQMLRPDAAEEPGVVYDLWAFDGASGTSAFRVANAIACAGPYWLADSRLVVYGWRNEWIVNPRTGTITELNQYVTPSPSDPNLGISFDTNDFYAVNLTDGSSRLIAHTTVVPAWDFLHEPLFAGSLIVFRSKHGGHGGCAEAIGVPESSRPELQFPPFPSE